MSPKADRDLSCSTQRVGGTGTAHLSAVPKQREQQGTAGTYCHFFLIVVFRALGIGTYENAIFHLAEQTVLFRRLGTTGTLFHFSIEIVFWNMGMRVSENDLLSINEKGALIPRLGITQKRGDKPSLIYTGLAFGLNRLGLLISNQTFWGSHMGEPVLAEAVCATLVPPTVKRRAGNLILIAFFISNLTPGGWDLA